MSVPDRVRCLIQLLLAVTALAKLLGAQGWHQQAPIRYGAAAAANAVTRLDQRLAAGELQLPVQGRSGRLQALLQALGVPVSSQTLVFSKTSLQRHRISLRNPRALYFGPDVYVGWVPGAAALEVAAGDPQLGLVFYTVSQDPEQAPRIVRDDSCLSCHASPRTDDEPGLLLRSVFPDADGDPITSAGETQVTTSTPLAERWGGWIVTGTFGSEHRGNGIAERAMAGTWRVRGRSAVALPAFADEFDATMYPAPTSDIGALLVLEQQATVHNLLVRASLQVRVALARDAQIDATTGAVGAHESTQHLLDALARDIAKALLLADEPDLTGHRAAPDPDFAALFVRQWPIDPEGASLGQLDLQERTFTLPLSPMVHAPAFAALPAVLRERVIERLHVAISRGRMPGGVCMTTEQHTSLRLHLEATLPGYPSR